MNRCEKAVTCEPESPRQVLVAPLACIVYKKHLLPTVKNSKISYKNLGLEPKGEKYCDYVATFLHGTYCSHWTLPPQGLDMPFQTLATWHQSTCAIGFGV